MWAGGDAYPRQVMVVRAAAGNFPKVCLGLTGRPW